MSNKRVLPFFICVTSLVIRSTCCAVVAITSPQNDVNVAAGRDLVITCDVSDLIETEQKNGKVVWGQISSTLETLTDNNVTVFIRTWSSGDRVTSQLTLKSLTHDDVIKFYCSWIFLGQTTAYVTVSVTGAPRITRLQMDRRPIAGREVQLSCTAQSKAYPVAEWTTPRGSSARNWPSNIYEVTVIPFSNDTVTSRLKLHRVTSEDEGTYTCVTYNQYGTTEKALELRLTLWASVYDPLLGESNPPTGGDLQSGLGERVIKCAAHNTPPSVEIGWSFKADEEDNFTPLQNNGEYLIPPSIVVPVDSSKRLYDVTSELQFRANFSSQGVFKCWARQNGSLLANAERFLSVEDLPALTLEPASVTVRVGEAVEVNCTVEARPPPTYSYWARNGQPLDVSAVTSRRVNLYTYQLRALVRVNVLNLDVITCHGTNQLGTTTARLLVLDKDECLALPCRENEACQNVQGAFLCACNSGFHRSPDGKCREDNASANSSRPVTTTLIPPTTGQPQTLASSATQSPGATTTAKRPPTAAATASSVTARWLPTIPTTASNVSEGRGEGTSGSPSGGVGGDGGSSAAVSAGAGVGVAVVFVILIVLAVTAACWKRRRRLGQKASYVQTVKGMPDVCASPKGVTCANPAFTWDGENLFCAPVSRDRSEFPRERLQVMETIGRSMFGTVVRALALSLQTHGKWDVVALKTLSESATDKEKEDFVKELTILRHLPRHENVVMFLGCCTINDPLMILMEYCEVGDLLTYLRKRRPDCTQDVLGNHLNPRDLLSFALQVARGMAHIATHNIVHRDVASRNVLLTSRLVCKMADFGLARQLDQGVSDSYEIVSRRPLPIRWMSPESLRHGYHTTQSDVWSYGVLVWELVTLGASPYPGKDVQTVIDFVLEGRQPDIPPQCTGLLSEIMTSCWKSRPTERPTFDVIAKELERLVQLQGDYWIVDNLRNGIYSVLEPSGLTAELV